MRTENNIVETFSHEFRNDELSKYKYITVVVQLVNVVTIYLPELVD